MANANEHDSNVTRRDLVRNVRCEEEENTKSDEDTGHGDQDERHAPGVVVREFRKADCGDCTGDVWWDGEELRFRGGVPHGFCYGGHGKFEA